jgi:hypothetical protein
MNQSRTFLYCLIAVFSFLTHARAHWIEGRIFCDANQNRIIDTSDTPFPGIEVVVTNTSGTFSNSNFSGNDGLYIVPVPDFVNDCYVAYLNPTTVPRDSGIIIPSNSVVNFCITSNQLIIVSDWLLNNPACQDNGGCWLTGGGTIRTGHGAATHSFGGVVFPGCSAAPSDGGQWTHVAHSLRLQFQGRVVSTVNCGNVAGIPPGSKSPVTPFNFIEFQGTGHLKGIAGNRTDLENVNFYARAEDRGEPGSRGQKKPLAVDRYYLRVFDNSGATLLLVSGNAANPTNIVSVPISTGNLQMHKCNDE